ncbi:membrane-associated oxidoreductase [Streptomyces sp. NPDC048428]|uniref:membrane-associated oxidoreductase n=1 Tax=Streptomyces sp. NPDC048428 TaxID=3154503 RepID=UPI00341B941B
MEILDLSSLERRLCRAFPRGEPIDLRQSRDEHAEHPNGWGSERTVRAEVIRTLLLDDPAEPGEVPALSLIGARITGLLNLRHAEIPHAIRLSACHFEDPPDFYGSRTRQLDLSASYLPALMATSLRVDDTLRLTDCRIPGSVQLGSAQVTGGIFLDRAHLGTDGGCVLQLSQASIGNDIRASELLAHGEIRLGAARVEGALDLEDARIRNAGGDALNAAHLTVGTVLNAAGLRTDGRVRLTGTKVTGLLTFIEARLSNAGGVALGVSNCEAGVFSLWDAAPVVGDIKMHYSHFKVIHAKPPVWPTTVRLEGLTYETLAPRLPAVQRLALLERDEDGFVPHAYEQLAASYRRVGDDGEARTVQLAKQRRHRTTLPWYGKVWGHLQDATVGYGFRPTRAMAWLLALLLLGSMAYGLHHPPPAEAGKGPAFNPAVYALDLLLPLVDFGQEKAFTPAGTYQWLSYLLIAAGWILATTIAAGVTRNLNRP